MIRLFCPVCGRAQEVPEEKEFIFCKYCGLRMNVAEVAAATAGALEAAAEPAFVSEVQAAAEAPVTEEIHAAPVEDAPQEAFSAPAEAAPQEIPAAPAETDPLYESITVEEPKKKKSAKGLIIGLIAFLLLAGGAAAAYFMILKPQNDYKAADELMKAGEYADAIDAFEALGDYKDAPAKIDECLLQKALGELKSGKYSRAVKSLKNIANQEMDTSAFTKEAQSAFAALLRSAPADAKSMSEELSGYIGDLEEAVKSRFTELMSTGKSEDASAAEELLDTFQDKVDLSFVTEGLSKSFSKLIGEGRYTDADRLLKTFRIKIPDAGFVYDILGTKISSLLEQDDYAQVVTVLDVFEELDLDIGAALLENFTKQLEAGDDAKLEAVLDNFSYQLGDKAPYEEAVKGKMQALLAEKKDEAVISLYNAVYYRLDGSGLLSETVTEAMKQSVEAMDADRINSLYESFSYYVSPLDQAEDKIISLIAMLKYDEALDFMNRLDGSYFDFLPLKSEIAYGYLTYAEFDKAIALYEEIGAYQNDEEHLKEAKYGKARALAEAGETEKACEIFKELGDYKDSRAMLADIGYQAVIDKINALYAANAFTPDEFESVYRELAEMGDYMEAPDYLDKIILLWYAYIIDSDSELCMGFAERMNEVVSLSSEQQKMLLDYVVEKTYDMVVYKDGQRVVYRTPEMQALLVMMQTQFAGMDDPVADAFVNYVDFLLDPVIETLPTIEDIRLLWPLRPDMQAFCSDRYPLMAFLEGVWTTGTEGELISMTRHEDSHFTLHYELPWAPVGSYLDAVSLGLSVMDEDGNETYRICDITIVGLDTIELYNTKDGKVYTMTRTEN